jgi:hypothetical protein
MHIHQPIDKMLSKLPNYTFIHLKILKWKFKNNTNLSYSIICLKFGPEQYSKIIQRWFLVSYQFINYKIFMWLILWNILSLKNHILHDIIKTSFKTFFLLDFSRLLTATYSIDFFFLPLKNIFSMENIILYIQQNIFPFLFLHKYENCSF